MPLSAKLQGHSPFDSKQILKGRYSRCINHIQSEASLTSNASNVSIERRAITQGYPVKLLYKRICNQTLLGK